MAYTADQARRALCDLLKADNPEEAADDLIEWYNIREDSLDEEALYRLADLYNAGRFGAWDCPTCGERVFFGDPEDWGDFQGILNQDFASYPAGREDQCDHCRCYHPNEEA